MQESLHLQRHCLDLATAVNGTRSSLGHLASKLATRLGDGDYGSGRVAKRDLANRLCDVPGTSHVVACLACRLVHVLSFMYVAVKPDCS